MKAKRYPLLMALGAALLLGAAALLAQPAAPRAESQVSAENAVQLSQTSEVLQTLTYTRCQHVVTRRFTAPVETYGKGLSEVQQLYPDWKITGFSAAEVSMEKQLSLFCPDHMVLMPDGAGMLCVFENKYGDALALVRETGVELSSLPAAAQEDVAGGLGFSTAQELEQWLESVES